MTNTPTPHASHARRAAEQLNHAFNLYAWDEAKDEAEQIVQQAIDAATSEVREERDRLLASDEYNFGLLKKCHRILQMRDDESYSLIPGEIEEWIASHGLVKDKEVKATDRAIRLQMDLAAARSLLGEAEDGLREIASQELSTEQEDNIRESADYQTGYDMCVEHARSTLAKLRQGREGK